MSTKILVVDDEPDVEELLRQRFRRKIQEGTYQLQFAGDGLAAVARLQAEPDFDVLLLDINMPGMDGLTLLGQLPDLAPHSRAVIVSAYSDMDNIRAAMNQGAFDFVCKPIHFSDLETTIEKTAHHVRQLRESAQAKAIADLKTRFFDNITHEFRTPLTLILSPLERLLRVHSDTADSRRDLLAIDRNARHLLRLINQLLELAKLEAGHLRVDLQPGNLAEFVDQLVQSFMPFARQKGLDLTYHTDLTGIWHFDAQKVGQIAYNLIANALKFTLHQADHTTSSGQIAVRLEAGSTIRLIVTDSGIGISTASLPHIFDRFYQAHSTSIQLSSGTGIGLSLVKELTELMGGQVKVQSSTGGPATPSGTTFTVELPLVPAQEVQTTSLENHTLWEWFSPATPPGPATAPENHAPDEAPLILLVEDNEELLNYLATELVPRYRVLTARSGDIGWQLAQAELPDVIVSDVMMPGLDGYGLTHRVKTTAATDHIAVVLLTAKAAYDSRMMGLRQGADDYLTKPFHFEELALRLHNLLSRQQRLRSFYSDQLTRPELPQPLETVQEGWLRTLYAVLETNLDSSSLSVEWLAREMAMSRKTLLRKVQSLTQLSPNELIRQYRLRKAADYLRFGHTVSETAYLVGFDTPTYFGQCFKEQYGITPSDFASSLPSDSSF